MKKIKHKLQGASLILAVILLWYAPGITHNIAMTISSTIIIINAGLEILG